MPGFALNRAQAACVSRLFQGLADGKPAVAEEELLKGGGSQDDVRAIPGQQGQDTRANLGVAVRSAAIQPNTWRLNVPEAAKFPSGTPAAGTGGLPSDDETHKN